MKISNYKLKCLTVAAFAAILVLAGWDFALPLRRNFANKILSGEVGSLEYSKASILDPSNPAVLIWQGDQALREGNFRLAEKKYLAAGELEKYALALLFQDKIQEAEKALKESGNLSEPASSDFQKNLTDAKNLAEKLYWLKKQEAVSPLSRDLWVLLADIDFQINNFELAKKHLAAAEKLDPSSADIKIMQAKTALASMATEEADEYFLEAQDMGADKDDLAALQKMLNEAQKRQAVSGD